MTLSMVTFVPKEAGTLVKTAPIFSDAKIVLPVIRYFSTLNLCTVFVVDVFAFTVEFVVCAFMSGKKKIAPPAAATTMTGRRVRQNFPAAQHSAAATRWA